MEHSAQGKRSDTLGLPMLEQSRPERAKALLCALDFYRTAIFLFQAPRSMASYNCNASRSSLTLMYSSAVCERDD